MIDVKITLPNENQAADFSNFVDINDNKFTNINFLINKKISNADFWFVFEDLDKDIEHCRVPKKNVIYLNTETSFKKNHFFQNYMHSYISQFGTTYSCYPMDHNNLINAIPFLPWMIHANYDASPLDISKMNYKTLEKNNQSNKTIDLSVICSNKTNTENHVLRIEFLKILKNYFGNKLEWYGAGFKDIENKSNVIFDSKYHLVLENDSKNNLISEKLFDAFLGESFPIYYGAPNVGDYFLRDSYKSIDINNIDESIKNIEDLIESDIYLENINELRDSKNKVLNEYNFINRILDIVFEKSKILTDKEFVTELYSSQYFWKSLTPLKLKFKKNIKRKLRLN